MMIRKVGKWRLVSIGVVICMFLFCSASFAATLFTTTIRETKVSVVQDMILDVMTGKNFSVDEVDQHKIVVAKNFGDGVFLASKLCKVKFNMLERDGNVKLMVSEVELIQGQMMRQRSIDHLVPLIREIRSKIDGTPENQIANEVVNQLPGSGKVREKSLGIVLGERSEDGCIRIKQIEPGSKAAEAGLLAKDTILEINGRSTKDMDTPSLKAYMANKAANKSSIIITYSRNSETNTLTIKN